MSFFRSSFLYAPLQENKCFMRLLYDLVRHLLFFLTMPWIGLQLALTPYNNVLSILLKNEMFYVLAFFLSFFYSNQG